MADVQTYRPQNFNGMKALREECFPNDPPWNKAEVVIPAKIATKLELWQYEICDCYSCAKHSIFTRHKTRPGDDKCILKSAADAEDGQ